MNEYRLLLPRVAALVAIGLGVLGARLFAAAADRAARFCTSCDIACAPGQNHAVHLARCWQPVVEWRFDRDLSNWQIKNYQQALKIEIADDAAVGRSLFVHRDDKEIDTAFELTSPPIPFAEAALCRLTITAAHTLDLSMAQGHTESFQNQIRWLDRDGRAVEATPFRFAAPSDAWYDVTVESRAPRGAATAVVQIGFDSPNLFSSRQFRLRSVAWFAQPDPPQYAAEGEMLSRPQRMTEPCEQGRVLWQADTPEGTRVGLQVRSAADRDGGPCDWTPLAGPDGTPNSQFTSSGAELPAIHAGHHWFQYRLTLGTNRAAVTPVVRQVRLGDEQRWIEDRAWSGADTSPPQLLAIHTYHAQRDADLQEFYAAAEHHGLRVIIAPRGGANSRDPQNAGRTVIEECCQPTLLAWYLADDTASHISADELWRVHRAIRDVDPRLPIPKTDLHLAVGLGAIHWPATIRALDDSGYRGPAVIEGARIGCRKGPCSEWQYVNRPRCGLPGRDSPSSPRQLHRVDQVRQRHRPQQDPNRTGRKVEGKAPRRSTCLDGL